MQYTATATAEGGDTHRVTLTTLLACVFSRAQNMDLLRWLAGRFEAGQNIVLTVVDNAHQVVHRSQHIATTKGGRPWVEGELFLPGTKPGAAERATASKKPIDISATKRWCQVRDKRTIVTFALKRKIITSKSVTKAEAIEAIMNHAAEHNARLRGETPETDAEPF